MLQDTLDAKPQQSNRQNHHAEQRNIVAATIPVNPNFDDVYNAGMAAMLGNAPTYNGNKAEHAASAPPGPTSKKLMQCYHHQSHLHWGMGPYHLKRMISWER